MVSRNQSLFVLLLFFFCFRSHFCDAVASFWKILTKSKTFKHYFLILINGTFLLSFFPQKIKVNFWRFFYYEQNQQQYNIYIFKTQSYRIWKWPPLELKLMSVSGLSVLTLSDRRSQKYFVLFMGILFFLVSNCSGSFMLCSECEQVTHTVFCDLVKLASGKQLKHINQCQLSFNSMHNYIYIVGKMKKSHKSIRISK